MIQGTPEDIIQQSIDSIEIEPELLTLERIEDTIRSTKQLRDDKIEALFAKNTQLQQLVNNYTNEINLLNRISDYNYEIIQGLSAFKDYNVSEINKDENIFRVLNKKSIELDNLKVSIAKTLNDLESSLSSLKLSKSSLGIELDEIKEKVVSLFNNPFERRENDDLLDQDSHILKINLYRNLGVRIENFDTQENENDRVLVFNKETNLTSVLKVDDKYSDFFISNYIWDTITS
ncbi:Spc24-domain-containing protein [Suhomyces tanzawaensis NRRL Y-17324]|uniref:Kinetochore protein Spc24 n=1 Tax=Suhomyces tanzawaensis NRRL Y-17324 TaxID=984487 RepID=A0A1E4SCQ8_9ASCO|nr:Spc24-domain-containing protein [Suhomyces tanzawaensis NRRL Y-17324]ODV77289.1 Spc24-domain-containing protein [Suhomyces tanzawaensis NRRL Y-17324]